MTSPPHDPDIQTDTAPDIQIKLDQLENKLIWADLYPSIAPIIIEIGLAKDAFYLRPPRKIRTKTSWALKNHSSTHGY